MTLGTKGSVGDGVGVCGAGMEAVLRFRQAVDSSSHLKKGSLANTQ